MLVRFLLFLALVICASGVSFSITAGVKRMFGKFRGSAQSSRAPMTESATGLNTGAKASVHAKQAPTIQKERSMLPALPPHEDKCYLVEFVSDRSEPCKKMAPLVRQVQKELKVKFRTINISKSPSFLQLYECVGGNECGNLPFYYNRRTAQAICGKTDYDNLLNLAAGDTAAFRQDPEEDTRKAMLEHRDPREQGWKGWLNEKVYKKN